MILFSLISTAVAAQEDKLQLEPVVVTATRLAQPLGDVPAAVSVV